MDVAVRRPDTPFRVVAGVPSLLSGYDPGGFYDEMLAAPGTPRTHYAKAHRALSAMTAAALARRHGAEALVTGDSLGQVASQTLTNLAVVGAAAGLPVLRPLIGADKNEITDEAARLGTLETSNIPDQDCCTLFVPRHPATRAQVDDVAAAERLFDVPTLVRQAVEGTERLSFRFPVPVDDAPGVGALTT